MLHIVMLATANMQMLLGFYLCSWCRVASSWDFSHCTTKQLMWLPQWLLQQQQWEEEDTEQLLLYKLFLKQDHTRSTVFELRKPASIGEKDHSEDLG